MNLLGIIETLRRNLKTVVLGCYAVLALLVVLDVVRLLSGGEHVAPADHAAVAEHTTPAHLPSEASAEEGGFWSTLYHIAESLPAFWTAFGLVGCLILVIVSKFIGHAIVSKREDYYHE